MFKRNIIFLTMLAILMMIPAVSYADSDASYSYKITPLLEPFNQFFFVETDNPDPRSFRFYDEASIYNDDPTISLKYDSWEEKPVIYADIRYEDAETGRVNGGYIFYSGKTDGGRIRLQTTENANARKPVWEDTSKTFSLPELKDNADYLIDTYARGDGFFDKMDSVQSGFSSICLYSGSVVRGILNKTDDFWFITASTHADQDFAICSPYEREDSVPLFASNIYPYRYDSLGFPALLGVISERLDNTSSYKKNETKHYLIDVTYNGETREYGGAGSWEGQGISKDKIVKYYSFGAGEPAITLDDTKSLLVQYASVNMDDDIPEDGRITWGQVLDTVNEGSWVRVSTAYIKVNGKWSFTEPAYNFFYRDGNGKQILSKDGASGYSLIYGGDLHFGRDAWVDGRYIAQNKKYIPGKVFEDYPTSDIILTDVTVPYIDVDSTENGYTATATEVKATVRFIYDGSMWKADTKTSDPSYSDYERVKYLRSKKLISENDAERYYDMLTITPEEIDSLDLDRNTNKVPDKGFIFDGTAEPGSVFDESRGHCWGYGKVTKKPDCCNAGEKTFTCEVCGATRTESVPKTAHNLYRYEAEPATCYSEGNLEYWECRDCGKYFIDEECKKEVEYSSLVTPELEHEWVEVSGSEIPPTCTEYGKEIDMECRLCHEVKEGSLIDVIDHDLKEVKRKKATDEHNGNIRYWICSECGQCFSDDFWLDEIDKKDTVIKKNNISVKAKTVTVKAGKKVNIKTRKAFTVKNAKGRVRYKKLKGNNKVKVLSNGKVSVKKGLKKGKTYKIKVRITSASTSKYEEVVRDVVLKLKVK